MGNPRHTANQTHNIGNGSSFDGVLARTGSQLASLNVYDDILASWCNHGDPVCAVGSEPVNITAHWSYYDEYAEVASRWVVATALGQTDVRLDLDLDGRNESIVLSGRNGSGNASANSGGTEDQSQSEDAGVRLGAGSFGPCFGSTLFAVLVGAGIVSPF
jgi:acetylxylan esterase